MKTRELIGLGCAGASWPHACEAGAHPCAAPPARGGLRVGFSYTTAVFRSKGFAAREEKSAGKRPLPGLSAGLGGGGGGKTGSVSGRFRL
ncbi:hypothetical protein DCO57_23005 [Labrenzia sp. 011]|nr:hypothetical protein DCO57_23005 [Labrenzia sp. 011]